MWDMGHKRHPPFSAPSLPPVVTHALPPVNPPFKEVAQLHFTGSKQQMMSKPTPRLHVVQTLTLGFCWLQ